MRRPLTLVLFFLSACGAGTAPVSDPATSSEAAPSETRHETPHAITPRAAQASRGGTVVTLSDTPGPLVDGNAPPPPPGSVPATHAALTASCSGDALGCSEAGREVRAATSFDDALRRLEALGFDIVTE